MNHWVRYLRVIFGAGILGGLLATGTGHLLNDPKPFPRSVAAGITALFVGCGLVSQTFASRRLTMFDRAALIAFLAAFVGGIVKDSPTSSLIGLTLGFGCLFVAWMRARLSSTPPRESSDAAQDL